MNIISESEKLGRMQDGISTILKLDDKQFDKVIERLSVDGQNLETFHFYYKNDGCEISSNPIQIGLEEENKDGKIIKRAYYANNSKMRLPVLFGHLKRLAAGFPENSRECERIYRLLEARDLEAYKNRYLKLNNGEERVVVDKAFEIISNPELLEKFLDFDNNKEEFVVGGKQLQSKQILKVIGESFGTIGYSGSFMGDTSFYQDFYISEMEQYENSVRKIYNSYNMDRYIDPKYEFKRSSFYETIIRKDDEPDFTINPELQASIMGEMPEDLSLKEQAIYIYCKLCKELTYDEGYMYKNKLNRERYDSIFSKEYLESIKPRFKSYLL